MHFEITSRRFMFISSASSVGVRWTAKGDPPPLNPLNPLIRLTQDVYRLSPTCQPFSAEIAGLLDRIRDVDEAMLDPETLRDELAEPPDAEGLGRMVARGDEVDPGLAR